MKHIPLLLAVLFGLLSFRVAAAPLVEIARPDVEISLSPYVDVLEDKGAVLTIQDVISEQYSFQFAPASSSEMFFASPDSAYWIRFTIENQLDEPMDFVLETAPADIDYVDLYAIDPQTGNIIQHRQLGSAMPYGDRQYDYPLNLFNIFADEHTAYTFFLRVESDKPVNLELSLNSPSNYLHIAGKRDWWQGFLIGALAIMALIHAGLFMVFRFKGFFWYSLLMISILFVQISWNGYLLQFYNNHAELLDHQLMTPIYLSIFFSAIFTQYLAATRKRVLWQHQVLNGFAALAIIGAVATWFIPVQMNATLAACLATISIIFVFAVALHANMDEIVMARHFLAVRAFTTTVMLIAVFNASGYLPQGAFTSWGVALILIIEAVVVAISMAWCCFFEARESAHANENQPEGSVTRHSLVNLADVCHELRTPISGVLGMADLLLSSNVTDQQRNQIKTISRSGQTLLDVTNKLSDLSSIERGNVELNVAPFELTPLIESCIESCRGRAEFNNIELIYHIDSQLSGFINADQEKLQQSIINLLQFALRHVEQGEVVLSANVSMDKGVVFTVQSGQNTLVERNVVTQNREVGSSDHLNLIIAEQYIKLMGGNLSLHFYIDGGVNASFELPLDIHQVNAIDNQDVNAILHGRRMLIVDDNATCCSIIEQQAAQWGMIVQSAHGGKEALAILRANTTTDNLFDVVLMDYEMPGMNGLELAEHISEDYRINSKKLLMIMLTGVSRAPSKLIAENAAIQRVLYKPLSGKSLKQALQSALSQHLQAPQ